MRDSVRFLLDAITEAPAFVRNERRDILAANHLGRALYAPMYEDPIQPPNTARFIFLEPRAREFYHDWDHAANNVVAIQRTASGKHPNDRRLADLVSHLPSGARSSVPDGPPTTCVTITPGASITTIL